jgi:hypothetical protein
VTVQVYRGSVDFATVQSATPLTTVVSDTDGFFTAPLGPGSYTFMFRHSNWGPGTSGGPVAVASGRGVAVPVFASVP